MGRKRQGSRAVWCLVDRGSYGIMRANSNFNYILRLEEDIRKTYISDHIQASRLAGWRVVLHSTSPSALHELGFVRLDAANVDELLNVVS